MIPSGAPWSRTANISDYDGALDKQANKYEAFEPYAAACLRLLQASLGSGYTTNPSSYVYASLVSRARLFGELWLRLPERFICNTVPLTSDERAYYWATVQSVSFSPGESRQLVRQRCAFQWRLMTGASPQAIDQALRDLCGTQYVATWRNLSNALSNPPVPTFSSGSTPAYDLGGGNWTSARGNISVQLGNIKPVSNYLALLSQVTELLDRALPASVTFQVQGSGFYLDISALSIDGMFI